MQSKAVKSMRITAGLITVLMLAILLCSSLFIAIEAHHDCAGEDCSVCAMIETCENVLNRAVDSASAGAAAIIPVVLSALVFLTSATDVLFATPVSQKIRLNN